MLILALDTTTRAGSAALVRDGQVLAAFDGDETRTHGERLPGELARVLEAAGVALADVDLLAVASGPGAFTGLRIGLAAMQGVALAMNIPVIGVSALEALALSTFEAMDGSPERIGAWMDAGRGEVFAALYDVERLPGDDSGADPPVRLVPLAGPEVGTPEGVWAGWAAWRTPGMAVAGDGAVRYAARLGPDVRVLPHPRLAPALARLAQWTAAAGERHQPHQLQPLYVRRPDVSHG